MAYHDHYMNGGGSHVLVWLLFVLLLALLVGLIVLVAARSSAFHKAVAAPAPVGLKPGDDPQELVRLRYARGEIDRETFLQVSQDLGGSGPPPA
jgi:uncharacterized membrane protein